MSRGRGFSSVAALSHLVFQNVERLLENVGIKVGDLGAGGWWDMGQGLGLY